MAVNLYFDKVEVFKFKESGLKALLLETADYLEKDAARDDVDVNSATFVDDGRLIKFSFLRRDI